MLGVTLFGIFLTPIFYYVIQWFKDRRGTNHRVTENIERNTEEKQKEKENHEDAFIF